MKEAFSCFLFLVSTVAFADTDITTNTGNELIQYCNDANVNNPDTSNLGFQICMSYIRGVVDGIDIGSGLATTHYKHLKNVPLPVVHGNDGVNYCLPSNVTLGQQARVVTKYLDDHPADLNSPDWSLVYAALKGAWPCNQK